MFTKIRSIYGTIGVMLFLIAMYLVLTHGTETSDLISVASQATQGIARTLQGR
jgi:hypothetical protein